MSRIFSLEAEADNGCYIVVSLLGMRTFTTTTHAPSLLLLFNNNVRRREEHGDRGDHCEGSEGDQAEPVDHHGCELPITDDVDLLVVNFHAIGDELELLEAE